MRSFRSPDLVICCLTSDLNERRMGNELGGSYQWGLFPASLKYMEYFERRSRTLRHDVASRFHVAILDRRAPVCAILEAHLVIAHGAA